MKKILYSAFFINFFIIVYFWWQGSGNLFTVDLTNSLLAIARLCGLLAVYFVLLQFVLRGRAVWVEEVFGLNNLSKVHRLNGYLSLSFILVHVLLILTSYSLLTNVSFVEQFITFVTTDRNLFFAFVGATLFVGIVFSSIYIVKKQLPYETWYYIHLASYLAVLSAWWHQLILGGDFFQNLFVWYWYILYIFVFGNLIVFRWLRQVYLFVKYRFAVSHIVREADGAASVYITGNNLSKFVIKPGQFMILRFLDKKRWWQAHPFSLSFVPKENMLRVTIKNVGDFTSQIEKIQKGTPILLDGPLGTFTKSHATKDKFLFIAGGIGITPIRAIIEEIAPLKKNLVLLYSNKTTDIILKKELDALSAKYKFPIHYVVTEDNLYKGEKGRIDGEKIKRLVPDFLKRDIYICGPIPMMKALIKTLKQMGVSRSFLHYEQFDL
jgi:predicted ferric reductase